MQHCCINLLLLSKTNTVMFKNNKYFTLFLFALVGTLTITSCGDDDPEPPMEEELITTLNYTLTSSSGNTFTVSFLDLDGDGGMDATIGTATLEANETYTGSIELLNESEDPAEDITEEIMEEDDVHQFFFESSVAGLSVSYSDADDDGNPLGLANTLTTGDPGSGTLTVTLRHEPDKNADGVSGGNIANAGGSTDIEVPFPVNVQ